MDDLETFVDFVFDDLTGYVYAPIKKPDDWVQRFFSYPAQKEELLDWIKTNSSEEGSNVYLSPAVYSEKRADKASFKSSKVVWVEFDGQDAIDFKSVPTPSCIVQTSSSTHLHCYWKLDAPVGKDTLEDITYRLTYYLEADGSGWDATQILRPPSTQNWKHNLPVLMAHKDSSVHETSSFDAAPKRARIEVAVEETQIVNAKKLLLSLPIPAELKKKIQTEEPSVGQRSQFYFKLGNELAEAGCDKIQIVSLLAFVDDRVGKFKNRKDRLHRLSQIADIALHKVEVAEAVTLYTLKDILHHTDNLDWIIPGWLHTTGFVILTSAPGVGKTQLTLQLGLDLVNDLAFLGKSAFKHDREHRVLCLSLEMDVRSLKYIVGHQSKSITDQFDWDRFIVIDEEQEFLKYEEIIEKFQPTVVMIDSITELMGEELNTMEARRAIKWIKRIRRKYGVAVWAIHHNRKNSEGAKRPKSINELYGAFLFGKDCDTCINLWETKANQPLEIYTLKSRFSQKEEFLIQRNENLIFSRVEKVEKNVGGDKRGLGKGSASLDLM